MFINFLFTELQCVATFVLLDSHQIKDCKSRSFGFPTAKLLKSNVKRAFISA